MIKERLDFRKTHGIQRQLRETKPLIDLTSNDYFGFAQFPKHTTCYPLGGSTGSRLLTGNHPYHTLLEDELATFHKAKSALLFTSGYTANLGLISALGAPRTHFLYDQECHASTRDGITLSKSKSTSFRHNDLDHLEALLKNTSGNVYVLVESLYSISGTIAPLYELSTLSRHHGTHPIVDEAHATGIFGSKGEGLVAELQLENSVFARVCTFSKALGAHGACVLSNKELKEYLINFSRPFIYTTSAPELLVHHIRLAYKRLEIEASEHKKVLRSLFLYFESLFEIKMKSPIYPFVLGSAKAVQEASLMLQMHGIDVRPIVFPTTAKGKESLRIVLHSFNTLEQIDLLAKVLL